MNRLKLPALTFIRTYVRGAPKLPGVRRRLGLIQRKEGENVDLEDLDPHDISQFESDLMEVGKSFEYHQRDMIHAKERLKQQIVASKYFKQQEPSFLTFIEKHQIQKLHKSDPEEWTVQRLSESFPALPESIRKVLKSKWIPDSVETVVRYDNNVIQNWEKFRSGNLVVSDALRDHLMKFKDRQISSTDRHLIAEKLVRPKMEFPKPKCRLFSSIVEKYVSEPDSAVEKLALSAGEINQNENHFAISNNNDSDKTLTAVNYQKSHVKGQNKKLQFNEFIKSTLPKLHETSPEEGSALLSAYKEQIESKEEHATNKSEKLSFEKSIADADTVETGQEEAKLDPMELAKKKLKELYESGTPEKGIGLLDIHKKLQNKELKKMKRESKKATHISNTNEDKTPMVSSTKSTHLTLTAEVESKGQLVESKSYEIQSSLNTFIKERINKIDMICEYAKSIKIPKNMFKAGMTYRIQDCYYDDDGEFLYRVPGLK